MYINFVRKKTLHNPIHHPIHNSVHLKVGEKHPSYTTVVVAAVVYFLQCSITPQYINLLSQVYLQCLKKNVIKIVKIFFIIIQTPII